jgi:glutathione S-transferase
MKLIYSPTSPYARKVRVVAAECGHRDIEYVVENPLAEDSELATLNPLGKVPALVLDDGDVLIDSPVICEFLDYFNRTPTLVPPSGRERFRVLRDQALGDGILDAAVGIVMESRREESQRSAWWIERWSAAITRSLAYCEKNIAGKAAGFDIAAITLACACGYLEFRLPDLEWRNDNPKIAAWWDSLRSRPSLAQTAPES